MPLLASKANPRFKALLARLRPGGAQRTSTLLLGGKLIEAWAERRETPAGGRLRPALWLRLEGAGPHPLAAELGLETLILGESLLRELAEAGSPPEHALLVEVGAEPTGSLPGRVIGAWGIQDPGNLGALLRSAAAFGFQEALLGPGCADPFSPKALRGSMGAAFLMPLRRVEALVPDRNEGDPPPPSVALRPPCAPHGVIGHWYALDGGPGAEPLAGADLSEPLCLWVGNEGHGWAGVDLPPAVRRLAIPIRGVESLNAAVAAGIACYEADRRLRT